MIRGEVKSTDDVVSVDQRVVDHVVNEVSCALSTLLNTDNGTNAASAPSTDSIEVSIIQSSGDADDSNVSVGSSFNGHSQYRNEGSGYGTVRRRPRRNNATAHRQFNGGSSDFCGQKNGQCNSSVQPIMQFPPHNSHHHPQPFFYQPPMAPVMPPARPPPTVSPPLHDQYLYPSSSVIHNNMNFMNTPYGLTVPPNNSQYNYNMMPPSHNGRPFFPPRSPNHHQFPRPLNRMNDLFDEVVIRKQIEYYFCNENLVKDHYLKGLMDREGWVSVHLIALFPRIQAMTKDISLILTSLECSDFIELNVRRVHAKPSQLEYLDYKSSFPR
ncbi:hypothetical protein Scep_019076 [Stephania cephalantha]|uniref:HTH La-type RNA-binding domain-containing protein n=1 Tax=Stephania cephalantha TaxID=152367 RepID=A0AAP0IAH0_9MAGN